MTMPAYLMKQMSACGGCGACGACGPSPALIAATAGVDLAILIALAF